MPIMKLNDSHSEVEEISRHRRLDLSLSSLNGTLWHLAWPTVVENLLFSLVFFADKMEKCH